MRSQVPSPIVPPILVRKPSLVRERGIKSKDTLPDRERLLSDRAATPRRMLQGDALASAPGAPGRLAQPVAGGLRSPPDDQRDYRDRRPVQAGGVCAMGPPPAAGAVQLLQGRDGHRIAHVRMMVAFAAAAQPRGLAARPGRCRYILRGYPSFCFIL